MGGKGEILTSDFRFMRRGLSRLSYPWDKKDTNKWSKQNLSKAYHAVRITMLEPRGQRSNRSPTCIKYSLTSI
jgi:hypothetical protein